MLLDWARFLEKDFWGINTRYKRNKRLWYIDTVFRVANTSRRYEHQANENGQVEPPTGVPCMYVN